MKKILILTGALALLAGADANAQISVTFGEPGYEMRPDYPSEHYDIHRHRHNDYWARRQQEERAHRGHDEHGHR